jgi:hypothetical protein
VFESQISDFRVAAQRINREKEGCERKAQKGRPRKEDSERKSENRYSGVAPVIRQWMQAPTGKE